jgi:hypothetical protein
MTSEMHSYRRLPGKKKHFLAGSYTLWEGKDHLMQVFSRFGVEDYQRFYFEDIQAIVVVQTRQAVVRQSLIGLLTVVSAGIGLHLHGGPKMFFGGLAAALAGWLLIDRRRGPFCQTRLLTAVQTQILPALNRLKNTERVLSSLKASIETVQGKLG